MIGVSISEQKLWLYRVGRRHLQMMVSTSRLPPSNREHSQGTPRGLHSVARKIGEGCPKGTVFRGRVPEGLPYQERPAAENEPNLITSRILWLRGLEPGVNSGPGIDTHDRYIYIHGTNHEERIGRPDSHGCVLLSNPDVITLFGEVQEGDLVWIF